MESRLQVPSPVRAPTRINQGVHEQVKRHTDISLSLSPSSFLSLRINKSKDSWYTKDSDILSEISDFSTRYGGGVEVNMRNSLGCRPFLLFSPSVSCVQAFEIEATESLVQLEHCHRNILPVVCKEYFRRWVLLECSTRLSSIRGLWKQVSNHSVRPQWQRWCARRKLLKVRPTMLTPWSWKGPRKPGSIPVSYRGRNQEVVFPQECLI